VKRKRVVLRRPSALLGTQEVEIHNCRSALAAVSFGPIRSFLFSYLARQSGGEYRFVRMGRWHSVDCFKFHGCYG
jgi:hypothetical protein